MKTLFSILVLGMVSFLSFSQNLNEASNMVFLDDVNVTAANANYLFTVKDANTPAEVVSLQEDAARFNVELAPDFSEDVKIDLFEVKFKNNKGSLDAFYNYQGQIKSAYERFRNIRLPKQIQQQLYREHQGWTMTANLYASAYEDNELVNRTYKIELIKGLDKKNVVIRVN